MGKCDNCNQVIETKQYTVRDEMGTRYRCLCADCVKNLSDSQSCTLARDNPGTDIQTTISGQTKEHHRKATSNMYKVISILIGVVGFVFGIVFGAVYPIMTVEYEYPSIQMGDTTVVESFNMPIMLYTWLATVISFFLFWAIYNHLKNQESVLSKLNIIIANSQKQPEDNQ